jgi:hypothetical protein
MGTYSHSQEPLKEYNIYIKLDDTRMMVLESELYLDRHASVLTRRPPNPRYNMEFASPPPCSLSARPAVEMSSSSLQASDLDIFTIGRLSNPEFVNLALLVVENLDVSCHAMVLEECLDRPFALEFIFSGDYLTLAYNDFNMTDLAQRPK